ncbi:hypothetical protein [Hyphomicrobium sp.]|uniref:hypothetical protein n=1 Tax=Hyphomicrobium sp. TaxID=82 RepID=UPI0025BB6E5B|nr:hypothetical protein [Hyphomicrobium sp.]MCC7253827.1 hypothetical protein [Hyphomicrobium sp.]
MRAWTMWTARGLLKSINIDSTEARIQAAWERVQSAKDRGETARYEFAYLTNLPF